MIVPAATVKVIGFKKNVNDSEVFVGCQDNTSVMRFQLDNNSVVDVPIISTDKSFSANLKDFLESKLKGVTKSSEISKYVNELMFAMTDTENVGLQRQIENEKKRIKNNNPNIQNQALVKQALNAVALNQIQEKRRISATSIIRVPLALDKDGKITNSRAMQVATNKDGNKEWGRGGLYYVAQAGNNLPIEITPIKNREGAFIGYFKIETSNLINSTQILNFLDHCIRTVRKLTSDGKKPFLAQLMVYNPWSKPVDKWYVQAVNDANQIERNNKEIKNGSLPPQEYERYINILEFIKTNLQKAPQTYKNFKAAIPLLLTSSDVKAMIYNVGEGGKSPLQRLSQSLVDLNFSRENPDVKNVGKNFLRNIVGDIHEGRNSFRMLTTMDFPALDPFGKSDAWGFMANNISSAKLNLSFNDTMGLYRELDMVINNYKNGI